MPTLEETATWERTIAVSAPLVYEALTNPYVLREWLCNAAEIDPRPSGRFYAWWHDGYYAAGMVSEAAPGNALGLTWHARGEAAPSGVRIALTAHEGGTQVAVSYSPAAGAVPQETARRWRDALDCLASLLEDGVDLRLARRPMVGLSGGRALEAGEAAALGVPVSAGILIAGTIEGMGAANAGMGKNDVLVSLDGHTINGSPDLQTALSGHVAGDRVAIVYYRGAERIERMMELSRRPAPDVPATHEALAALVRACYEAQNAEAAAAFATTEAAAKYRPTPQTWNVKEELAHLISVEYDVQRWLATLIEGGDYQDIYRSNLTLRLAAIVAANPTLGDLLDELRRASAVALAMVESLPASLIERKYLFNLLGESWKSNLEHAREHFAEVAALLQAAAQETAS